MGYTNEKLYIHIAKAILIIYRGGKSKIDLGGGGGFQGVPCIALCIVGYND